MKCPHDFDDVDSDPESPWLGRCRKCGKRVRLMPVTCERKDTMGFESPPASECPTCKGTDADCSWEPEAADDAFERAFQKRLNEPAREYPAGSYRLFADWGRDYGKREIAAEIERLTEKLALVGEALSISRGQWIHSVNKEQCLDALAAMSNNEKSAEIHHDDSDALKNREKVDASQPASAPEFPEEMLREVIGQAMGYASLCWVPAPSGEFDSTLCARALDHAIVSLADRWAECAKRMGK